MAERFQNRSDAGRRLAARLASYAGQDEVLVLGLPRGGVPVAFEIAMALDVPLDVFIVRKLGLPGHEEFGIGAIASGDVRVVDEAVLRTYDVDPETLERITARERLELERRERLYRDDRPFPTIEDRVVILVDDGLATGSTMRAAIAALRRRRPSKIVVAVPVGARETCAAMARLVEEVVCLEAPDPFYAVGLWYDDFEQTEDAEVHELLERAAVRSARHQ
ncbi:MAG TPA: phosphoribosyltransferase [Gemmatimonadaceae bacterium]|nr:phosphoribosyltransferase [Gemmatimonadaceae bacterium]